ncbi:MAG: RluA family pseudouridine synthase [Chlamydiota bacterium]
MENLNHNTWVVSSKYVGARLQAFLSQQLANAYSGKKIKQLIDTYGCRVNNKIEVFSSYKVKSGDRIQIDGQKLQGFVSKPLLKILYEDEDLWVVDKPPQLCSESKTLAQALNQQSVYLVHRLDKDTTGVLIVAKNSSTQKLLEELFKKREVHKVYHAIVEGKPLHPTFKVENSLGKISSYAGQSIWGEVACGDLALTYFEVLKKVKHYSLMKCMPVTGRTHQIRVHLKGESLPILGDYHYHRDKPFIYKAPRVFLHAYSVTFKHPKNEKMLTIEAPYPQDFNKALLEIFS